MSEEILDIIDDQGTVLQQAAKSEAHAQGLLHAVVIGYLRYGDDWALVTQSADRQDAGQLVAPVGGHVRSDESIEDALMREAREEIGTDSISYEFKGSAVMRRQVLGRDENHLFVVFEIATDQTVKLGVESVSLVRFTADQLKQELRDHPNRFGEAYYFVLEKFYPEYLPETWTKRWS